MHCDTARKDRPRSPNLLAFSAKLNSSKAPDCALRSSVVPLRWGTMMTWAVTKRAIISTAASNKNDHCISMVSESGHERSKKKQES